MEAQSVILGVLLVLSLVVTPIQADEKKCCPATYTATYCHNLSLGKCATAPDCQIIDKHLMCPILGNPEQIQVEPKKFCCPITYTATCDKFSPEGTCEKTSGCHIYIDKVFRGTCPMLRNSVQGAINEYCKLGCASSVCNAISTLQISGEEVVHEAVGQCSNACSAFCTKGATLEIA